VSGFAAEALELLLCRPAQLGRWSGFTRLTDDLHGQWIRQMLSSGEDLTLLADRGSCKTTCLSVAIAILMVTDPEKNILFLRETDEDVTEVIRQVRGILMGSAMRALSREIWGGSGVRLLRSTMSELTADCYASPRGAVQLLGQGIGGSLTGKHADLIITDDIVNLSDRLSAAEREHTRSIYRELQNIRNPGGRIINTGTPWHPEDAIAGMPNPERWDCYRTGLLTADQLDELRRSMPPSLFAANYELRHIASEEALLDTPPRFTDDADLLRDGIAHIDAAYGGADGTALTIGAVRNGQAVLYGRLWQAPVDRVLDEIIRACDRLMAAPIYCETNGDKGWLARELRSRGLSVRPYHESMAKPLKIAAYLRRQWPNTLILRETDHDWLAQLMDYSDRAAHDDAPDSAACVLRLLDRQLRSENEAE